MSNVATFIVSTVLPIVIACTTAIIAIIKTCTGSKSKKTLHSVCSYDDMHEKMLEYVKEAEKSYTAIKNVQGMDAGLFKRNYVITRLQVYAVSCGYDFDEEFWDAEIAKICEYTKEVNY